MNEEKKDGETTQFIKQMDGQLLGWDQPAERLRDALDHDQFQLEAQPVRELAGAGGVAFAEVLLRLREEETRTLPPGDFLPAFQHYGMAPELDRWVLSHALTGMSASRSLRRISINVSTQTLDDPGFAEFAAAQLGLAACEPQNLIIEIDENDAIDRRAAAERFAAAMKAAGCRILLDGFARRSVSFELLEALHADYVKVDGTLVRKLLRSAGAVAKLKAILKVGESTGVGVIAECVEDDRTLASLTLLKVGYVQGFGVGRPVLLQDLLS
ncbi:MAG: EAL domain-containing protein [Burkholderiales bacterium]